MKKRNCIRKARVLVVDDNPLARRGIHCFLEMQPGLVVCGESNSASDALKKVAELHPDIITIDLPLENENGWDLIRQMRAVNTKVKILVLSLHEEHWYVEHAAAAGAHGYVSKWLAPHTLVAAIREVMSPAPSESRHPEIEPPHARSSGVATQQVAMRRRMLTAATAS